MSDTGSPKKNFGLLLQGGLPVIVQSLGLRLWNLWGEDIRLPARTSEDPFPFSETNIQKTKFANEPRELLQKAVPTQR